MILYKTKQSKFARVDGGSDGQTLKKYSTSITGDGVKTIFTIEHNLDTEDIIFEMYDGTEPALIDYAVIDKNNVNITFAIAPTTEQSYSIKIYGVVDSDNNSGGGGSSDITTEVGIVNNDWDYTLDENAGTITLNYYTGSDENVKVYSSYTSDNGKTYKTRLASNTDNKFTEYMFANNTIVKSIIFSDDLDASTCTDTRNMFYKCTSLTNISLKNFNSTNVTNMCNMFYECTSLTNLDLSNFNTSNVTHMSSMFYNCKSLKNLNINSFDTSNVKSMEYMFDSCMVLENIDVSHFNTSNVTSMSCMFAMCYKLSSLELSNFDTSQVTIMYGMFMGCNSMGTLDLTSFDTKKVTNMNMMFNGCCSDYVYVTTGKWVMSQASQDHMFGSGGVSELTYV